MAIGGGLAMGTTASVGATTAQQTNEEETQEGAVESYISRQMSRPLMSM